MLLAFLLPATFGAVAVTKPLYTVSMDNQMAGLGALHRSNVADRTSRSLHSLVSDDSSPLSKSMAIRSLPLWCSGEIGPTNSIYFGFRSYGPLLSTTIALMVPIVLMYREIQPSLSLIEPSSSKRTLLGSILTVVMLLGVLIAGLILGWIFPPNGRVSSMIYIIVIGGLGLLSMEP